MVTYIVAFATVRVFVARDRLGRRSLVAARSSHGGTDARRFPLSSRDREKEGERDTESESSVTCTPSHGVKAASQVRLVAL